MATEYDMRERAREYKAEPITALRTLVRMRRVHEPGALPVGNMSKATLVLWLVGNDFGMDDTHDAVNAVMEEQRST
jgi:hypothetical protein